MYSVRLIIIRLLFSHHNNHLKASSLLSSLLR